MELNNNNHTVTVPKQNHKRKKLQRKLEQKISIKLAVVDQQKLQTQTLCNFVL